MARLVRGSSFDGPGVDVQPGAALTHVWVDGQRPELGYHKVTGGDGDNANVASLGGDGIDVSDKCRTTGCRTRRAARISTPMAGRAATRPWRGIW
jgi:hypothetical protein